MCFDSSPTSNDGVVLSPEDFKYLTYKGDKIEEANSFISAVKELLPFLKYFSFLKVVSNFYRERVKRAELERLKKYF
jgi:hypothetical protein